jgi:hypothetical protein
LGGLAVSPLRSFNNAWRIVGVLREHGVHHAIDEVNAYMDHEGVTELRRFLEETGEDARAGIKRLRQVAQIRYKVRCRVEEANPP